MIVGTRESLHALGTQLATESADKPARTDGWPPVVAVPETLGPYANGATFKLSFHLEGAAPLETVVPHRPTKTRGVLNTVVAVLAGVGVVAIVRWAVTGAL